MAAATSMAPSHRPTGPRTTSSTSIDSSSGSGSGSGSPDRGASSASLQVSGGQSIAGSSPSRGSGSSSSIMTTSSSSPHDPHRRPSASILANPQDCVPRSSIKPARTAKSAIKAAFIPPQPGKQSKAGSKPLGKTFERKVPLPKDLKIQGGQVLERDPRGDEASAGDGVVLPSPTSEDSPGSPGRPRGETVDSTNSQSDWGSTFSWGEAGSIAGSSTTALSSTDDDVDTNQQQHTRHRTDTMSSTMSSTSGTSSSANSCSIRFAPLPVSGRLKRANSITIGVAARSQLLSSQGAGRNAGFSSQPQQYQHLPQRNHPQNWQSGPAKQDDIIDLGEEISKRAKKAWLKMRGNKVTSPDQTPEAETPPALPGKTTSSNETSSSSSHSIAESGEKTPRRPSSPASSSLARLSLEDKEAFAGAKPSMDTIRGLHEEAAHDKPGSGAATPRAPADTDETQQHHHLPRRLSTGAFLGNASLRGMQEDRRRKILGLPEGEDGLGDDHDDFVDASDQPATTGATESRTGVQGLVDLLSPWSTTGNETSDKSSSAPRQSRIVEPHRNPEEEAFGGGEESENSRNDDEEEADEEELAEAERLAEASMQRSKENQAAGVEKVR